ncbi:MAG: hypothetical protein IK056_06345 [Clostridia bacterium]|nr:hypothetical protein [Clostridia bacterium]
MKKMLSVVLALVMALSVFAMANAEPLTNYVDYQTQANEVEYWCIQHSQGAVDLNVLCNCIDGLLTNNANGELIGCVATDWFTDDGSVWTFKLRDNVKWVDCEGEYMADLTSADFLYGLEFVLNYHKNEAANTSMPIEMIKGAGDYYEYTKALPAEEAMALGIDKLVEMVGIAAPDDYTVVYTLIAPLGYFPTVATYSCLSPISPALLEEIGADGYRNVTFDTLWYNGPYYVSEFVDRSYKILTPNPLYYNPDDKLFESVTVQMVNSGAEAFLLYEAGEIDNVTLTQDNLKAIYDNPEDPFHDYLIEMRPTKYSYQFHLNYHQKDAEGNDYEPWNKAIANENFRLAWYYGIDLTDWLARTNFINPLSCENYTYTAKGVATMSDGRDYTDVVREKLGLDYDYTVYNRFDAEKAAAYVAAAKEELTAAGVELPVKASYWVKAGNQPAWDSAETLKQCIEANLGELVELEINTYVSSLAQEVRNPSLYSFVINGWGADFGDPVNFLGQETYGDDNAYYAQYYSKINEASDEKLIATYEEFTELVNKAKAINDDLDARYNAFADAEVYMIQHALIVPCYNNIERQLSKINPYSTIYCAYGMMTYRYVNYDTNADGFTTAEIAAYKEAASAK